MYATQTVTGDRVVVSVGASGLEHRARLGDHRVH